MDRQFAQAVGGAFSWLFTIAIIASGVAGISLFVAVGAVIWAFLH